MARTESKVMSVHPKDEQSTIEFMQIFHWNLLNSQHVKNKTQSSHLERRGDDLYSVTETETEHFVNLAFSRDLDIPGIKRIQELEREHHHITDTLPKVPETSGYVLLFIVCFFLTFIYGIGLVIGYFWFMHIKNNNERISAEIPVVVAQRNQMKARLLEIETECENFAP